MVRSQRILIGISLPAIAVLMHASLCQWKWKVRIDQARPILVYQHRDSPGVGYGIFMGSGLFARVGSPDTAMLFGIVAPLVLCIADAYLMLGWRYERAIRRGRCPDCGYDRRGNTPHAGQRCPECGWSSRSSDSTADAT